ncbi:F-box/LRR-repeat protein At3g58900-like [Miscanthus floridulus]|uniref:F-box/LRR-repeat protein At3g58900-like n=1 Tax=Miscanthus floridulus TaxID=154761 RepID=UPI003457FAB0
MDTPSSKSARGMDAGDRISDLPDELLHHAMSFLLARDVVRTCVLSTRWRHLWVSMPYLSIDTGDFINQRSFIKFVTSLLLSRGCGPLDSFRLDANGPGIFLENFRDTAYLWICHALRSNVHTLSIMDHELKEEGEGESEERSDAFWLGHCPFMSLYLKQLHLRGVSVDKCFAKNLFSGCTALEDLDMINCVILATEFSSTTLKRLSIDYHGFCRSEGYDYEDIVINMPSLISLHIGALCAMLSLVDVQSLITASVCLDDQNATFPGALSSVKNLELLFPVCVGGEYSLQSNIQLCQVEFTNLTTLSISDWCLHDNCKVLLYMLKHSPNLVELTLKMREVFLSGLPCSLAGQAIYIRSISSTQLMLMTDMYLFFFVLLGSFLVVNILHCVVVLLL